MDEKKIKSKYKQCKYQHLKRIYSKNLSVLPENCKYNKQIRLPNKSIINICGFNFEDAYDVDLCYKPEHAKDCNAFCSKYTKESLYKEFMEEVKDDQIRATKFKDINTLYWMSPELKFEDFPEKESWYSRFLKLIKKYI